MEFSLKSNGDEIRELEQKCSYFLKYQGYSDATIQTQILILRELIKSGQQFKDLRQTGFEMSVQLHIENNTITLEVKKSVCESNCGKLEALDKTIQWIRSYQDPLERHIINLAETSDISHIVGINGLGLARIAHRTNVYY